MYLTVIKKRIINIALFGLIAFIGLSGIKSIEVKAETISYTTTEDVELYDEWSWSHVPHTFTTTKTSSGGGAVTITNSYGNTTYKTTSKGLVKAVSKCKDSDYTVTENIYIHAQATSVSLSCTQFSGGNALYLYEGDIVTVNSVTYPYNASNTTTKLASCSNAIQENKWVSENKSIATTTTNTNKATIKAISEGDTVITVSSAGKSNAKTSTIKVYVRKKPQLVLSDTNIVLVKDTKVNNAISYKIENQGVGSYKAVWSSGNTNLLSVSDSGATSPTLTTKGTGSTTLTCTLTDDVTSHNPLVSSYVESCKVEVIDRSLSVKTTKGLNITSDTTLSSTTEGFTVYLKIYEENGNITEVSSSDVNVATIKKTAGKNYNYVLKSVGCGTATITIKTEIGNTVSFKYVSHSKAPAIKSVKSTTSGVKIEWSKINKTKSYTVYRADSPNSDYKSIGTATGTSYVDKAVVFGNTYYYKVSATPNEGSTYASSLSETYKKCKHIPSTPKVKKIKKKNGGYRVSIKGSLYDGFVIYLSKRQKTKKAVASVTSKSATVFINKKGTYYVRIRAYKVINNKRIYSSYSKPKKIKVK